jgi:hypothetical protein
MTALISAQAIQAASVELQQKTLEEIETETAIRWGARALAAWRLATVTSVMSLKWVVAAVTYKGEALEHAVCATPGTLAALQQQLEIVP